METGHLRQSLLLVLFVGTKPNPWLQPAFARELETIVWGLSVGYNSIQVNRQRFADRRVSEAAFAEGTLAAEHQQSAATLANKLLDERELIVREKSSFDFIQNNCVIVK